MLALPSAGPTPQRLLSVSVPAYAPTARPDDDTPEPFVVGYRICVSCVYATKVKRERTCSSSGGLFHLFEDALSQPLHAAHRTRFFGPGPAIQLPGQFQTPPRGNARRQGAGTRQPSMPW